MKYVIAALLFVVSFSLLAEEKNKDLDKKFINSLIVNAKFAGVCGAYKQMADFQAATQLPGGDEFVNRFGATEVARLGMTIEGFTKLCTESIEAYNRMNKITQ